MRQRVRDPRKREREIPPSAECRNPGTRFPEKLHSHPEAVRESKETR